MNTAFLDLMKEATRRTRAGRLEEATAVIQRALAAAGLAGTGTGTGVGIDTCIDIDPGIAAGVDTITDATGKTAIGAAADGFWNGSQTEAGLTRAYKLFVPVAALEQSEPALVVMLHGCTQNPDDFAAGTDMNRLAAREGFCVLYPAQGQDANPSRCWNWFKHNHQARGKGEPAVIAAMTRKIVNAHGIDPSRVYIAGLSAGGAMAAIVGAAYPEVFAAVGVHSGLAPGSACSLPEALAAMRGAPGVKPAAGRSGRIDPLGRPRRRADPITLPLPLIVFHGDADRTVHVDNAGQLVAAALAAIDERPAPHSCSSVTECGASTRGRTYTRTLHRVDGGPVVIEQWVLHGAAHAWSGGTSSGSHTDPDGPDASSEMIRFFFERTGSGPAAGD